MLTRRFAAAFLVLLFAFSATLFLQPHVARAMGGFANNMCQPFHKDCECGMEPNKAAETDSKAPKCIKGKNTKGCKVGICWEDPAGVGEVKGICVAEKRCEARLCDGKACPGQPTEGSGGAPATEPPSGTVPPPEEPKPGEGGSPPSMPTPPGPTPDEQPKTEPKQDDSPKYDTWGNCIVGRCEDVPDVKTPVPEVNSFAEQLKEAEAKGGLWNWLKGEEATLQPKVESPDTPTETAGGSLFDAARKSDPITGFDVNPDGTDGARDGTDADKTNPVADTWKKIGDEVSDLSKRVQDYAQDTLNEWRRDPFGGEPEIDPIKQREELDSARLRELSDDYTAAVKSGDKEAIAEARRAWDQFTGGPLDNEAIRNPKAGDEVADDPLDRGNLDFKNNPQDLAALNKGVCTLGSCGTPEGGDSKLTPEQQAEQKALQDKIDAVQKSTCGYIGCLGDSVVPRSESDKALKEIQEVLNDYGVERIGNRLVLADPGDAKEMREDLGDSMKTYIENNAVASILENKAAGLAGDWYKTQYAGDPILQLAKPEGNNAKEMLNNFSETTQKFNDEVSEIKPLGYDSNGRPIYSSQDQLKVASLTAEYNAYAANARDSIIAQQKFDAGLTPESHVYQAIKKEEQAKDNAITMAERQLEKVRASNPATFRGNGEIPRGEAAWNAEVGRLERVIERLRAERADIAENAEIARTGNLDDLDSRYDKIVDRAYDTEGAAAKKLHEWTDSLKKGSELVGTYGEIFKAGFDGMIPLAAKLTLDVSAAATHGLQTLGAWGNELTDGGMPAFAADGKEAATCALNGCAVERAIAVADVAIVGQLVYGPIKAGGRAAFESFGFNAERAALSTSEARLVENFVSESSAVSVAKMDATAAAERVTASESTTGLLGGSSAPEELRIAAAEAQARVAAAEVNLERATAELNKSGIVVDTRAVAGREYEVLARATNNEAMLVRASENSSWQPASREVSESLFARVTPETINADRAALREIERADAPAMQELTKNVVPQMERELTALGGDSRTIFAEAQAGKLTEANAKLLKEVEDRIGFTYTDVAAVQKDLAAAGRATAREIEVADAASAQAKANLEAQLASTLPKGLNSTKPEIGQAFLKAEEAYNAAKYASVAERAAARRAIQEKFTALAEGVETLSEGQRLALYAVGNGKSINAATSFGKSAVSIGDYIGTRLTLGKGAQWEYLAPTQDLVTKFGEKYGQFLNEVGAPVKTIKGANPSEFIAAAKMSENGTASVIAMAPETRGHLVGLSLGTGAEQTALRQALGQTRKAVVDEVHNLAGSRTSSVISDSRRAVTAAEEAAVDNVMTKLGMRKTENGFEGVPSTVEKYSGTGAGNRVQMSEMLDANASKFEREFTKSNKPMYLVEQNLNGEVGAVRFNAAAQKELERVGLSSSDRTTQQVLRTLELKDGGVNGYKLVRDASGAEKYVPTDKLGKPQLEMQFSDPTLPLTAAKMNGRGAGANKVDTFVSTTKAETPLTHIYATNQGVLVGGMTGTAEGLQNLIRSGIGSEGVLAIKPSRVDLNGFRTEVETIAADGTRTKTAWTSETANARAQAAIGEGKNTLTVALTPAAFEEAQLAMRAVAGEGKAARLVEYGADGKVYVNGKETRQSFNSLAEEASTRQTAFIVDKKGIEGFNYKGDYVQTILTKSDKLTKDTAGNIVKEVAQLEREELVQALGRVGRTKEGGGTYAAERNVVVDSAALDSQLQGALAKGYKDEVAKALAANSSTEGLGARLFNTAQANSSKPGYGMSLNERLALSSDISTASTLSEARDFALRRGLNEASTNAPLKELLNTSGLSNAERTAVQAKYGERINVQTSNLDATIKPTTALNAVDAHIENVFKSTVADARSVYNELRSSLPSNLSPEMKSALAKWDSKLTAAENAKYADIGAQAKGTFAGAESPVEALAIAKGSLREGLIPPALVPEAASGLAARTAETSVVARVENAVASEIKSAVGGIRAATAGLRSGISGVVSGIGERLGFSTAQTTADDAIATANDNADAATRVVNDNGQLSASETNDNPTASDSRTSDLGDEAPVSAAPTRPYISPNIPKVVTQAFARSAIAASLLFAQPFTGDIIPDFNPFSTSVEAKGKGISNNNPGNMMLGKQPRRFSSLEVGTQADFNNVQKWIKRGDDTISKLMHRLSPAYENDTAGMIARISKAVGIGPNTKLDYTNQDQIIKLVNEKTFLEHSVRLTDKFSAEKIASIYQSTLPQGSTQYAKKETPAEETITSTATASKPPAPVEQFIAPDFAETLALNQIFKRLDTATWPQAPMIIPEGSQFPAADAMEGYERPQTTEGPIAKGEVTRGADLPQADTSIPSPNRSIEIPAAPTKTETTSPEKPAEPITKTTPDNSSSNSTLQKKLDDTRTSLKSAQARVQDLKKQIDAIVQKTAGVKKQELLIEQSERNLTTMGSARALLDRLTTTPNPAEHATLRNAANGASRLSNNIRALGDAALAAELRGYVNLLTAMQQPKNQTEQNLNTARSQGKALFSRSQKVIAQATSKADSVEDSDELEKIRKGLASELSAANANILTLQKVEQSTAAELKQAPAPESLQAPPVPEVQPVPTTPAETTPTPQETVVPELPNPIEVAPEAEKVPEFKQVPGGDDKLALPPDFSPDLRMYPNDLVGTSPSYTYASPISLKLALYAALGVRTYLPQSMIDKLDDVATMETETISFTKEELDSIRWKDMDKNAYQFALGHLNPDWSLKTGYVPPVANSGQEAGSQLMKDMADNAKVPSAETPEKVDAPESGTLTSAKPETLTPPLDVTTGGVPKGEVTRGPDLPAPQTPFPAADPMEGYDRPETWTGSIPRGEVTRGLNLEAPGTASKVQPTVQPTQPAPVRTQKEFEDLKLNYRLGRQTDQTAKEIIPAPVNTPAGLPNTTPLPRLASMSSAAVRAEISTSFERMQDYLETQARRNGGQYRRAELVIVDTTTALPKFTDIGSHFDIGSGKIVMDIAQLRKMEGYYSNTPGELVRYVVAHELGHYVAYMTGTVQASRVKLADYKVMPPLSEAIFTTPGAIEELQADALAGNMLVGSGLVGKDVFQTLRYAIGSLGDDLLRAQYSSNAPNPVFDGHSSGAQRANAFYDGIVNSTFDESMLMLGVRPDWNRVADSKDYKGEINWGNIVHSAVNPGQYAEFEGPLVEETVSESLTSFKPMIQPPSPEFAPLPTPVNPAPANPAPTSPAPANPVPANPTPANPAPTPGDRTPQPQPTNNTRTREEGQGEQAIARVDSPPSAPPAPTPFAPQAAQPLPTIQGQGSGKLDTRNTGNITVNAPAPTPAPTSMQGRGSALLDTRTGGTVTVNAPAPETISNKGNIDLLKADAAIANAIAKAFNDVITGVGSLLGRTQSKSAPNTAQSAQAEEIETESIAGQMLDHGVISLDDYREIIASQAREEAATPETEPVTPKNIEDVRNGYLNDPIAQTDAFKNFPRAKLTGDDAILQEASIAKYLAEKDALISQYQSLFGNKTANPDLARLLFKDIGYVGTNSGAVQKVSGELADEVWKRALQNEGKYAMLFVGGPGAGKSSTVSKFEGLLDGTVAAAMDGSVANVDAARARIAEIEAAGKIPVVEYVYRDPLDAWENGVISRMNGNSIDAGRVVPIQVFIATYKRSLEIAKTLSAEGTVRIDAIDNSRGVENISQMPPEDLQKLKYSSSVESKIRARTKELLAEGVITEEQYRAITGSEAPAKIAIAEAEPVVPVEVDTPAAAKAAEPIVETTSGQARSTPDVPYMQHSVPSGSPLKSIETIPIRELTPQMITGLQSEQAPDGYRYLYRGISRAYQSPYRDQFFSNSPDIAISYGKNVPESVLVRVMAPSEEIFKHVNVSGSMTANNGIGDVYQFPATWFTSEQEVVANQTAMNELIDTVITTDSLPDRVTKQQLELLSNRVLTDADIARKGYVLNPSGTYYERAKSAAVNLTDAAQSLAKAAVEAGQKGTFIPREAYVAPSGQNSPSVRQDAVRADGSGSVTKNINELNAFWAGLDAAQNGGAKTFSLQEVANINAKAYQDWRAEQSVWTRFRSAVPEPVTGVEPYVAPEEVVVPAQNAPSTPAPVTPEAAPEAAQPTTPQGWSAGGMVWSVVRSAFLPTNGFFSNLHALAWTGGISGVMWAVDGSNPYVTMPLLNLGVKAAITFPKALFNYAFDSEYRNDANATVKRVTGTANAAPDTTQPVQPTNTSPVTTTENLAPATSAVTPTPIPTTPPAAAEQVEPGNVPPPTLGTTPTIGGVGSNGMGGVTGGGGSGSGGGGLGSWFSKAKWWAGGLLGGGGLYAVLPSNPNTDTPAKTPAGEEKIGSTITTNKPDVTPGPAVPDVKKYPTETKPDVFPPPPTPKTPPKTDTPKTEAPKPQPQTRTDTPKPNPNPSPSPSPSPQPNTPGTSPSGGGGAGAFNGIMSALSGFLKGISGMLNPQPAQPTQTQPLVRGPISVQVSAQPNPILTGESSTITWTSVNATACRAFKTQTEQVAIGAPDTSFTVGPLTAKATYTIYCTNGTGAYATGSVQVLVK